MPVSFSIDPTPNPNAMKITVSAPLATAPATYNSAADGERDPFVKKLFAIGGVKSVFVMGNFATVTKDATADWNDLIPKLRDAVQSHFQGK